MHKDGPGKDPVIFIKALETALMPYFGRHRAQTIEAVIL